MLDIRTGGGVDSCTVEQRSRRLRLILVEDEPFIALDLELLVHSAGHQVVGVADSFDSAVALAQSLEPDAALVDINLRDGMSGVRISRALSTDQGVVVVFVTGNTEQIPADFAGAVGAVEKPFTEAGVSEVLSVLETARGGSSSAGGAQGLRFVRLPRSATA